MFIGGGVVFFLLVIGMVDEVVMFLCKFGEFMVNG